jgi:F-box domain
MRRSTDPGPAVNRKSSTNRTDHIEVVPRPPAQPRLPEHLQAKILSYLPCETLLAAMKVNESFRKAASEIILSRFLALPDLCFASAKRILDDTAGVYGFEGLGRGDAHQYLLDEEYPCEFRIMNDIFITRWTIPDSAFADMMSSGAWVKAFAFTAGERSRWVAIFKLDEIHRRRKSKRAKATSVSAAQELYYLDRSGHPIRGEWTNRKQRSKLVFVPETDEWYFTWPLAALAGWGIMSEEA